MVAKGESASKTESDKQGSLYREGAPTRVGHTGKPHRHSILVIVLLAVTVIIHLLPLLIVLALVLLVVWLLFFRRRPPRAVAYSLCSASFFCACCH